mmetsp:Transcript_98981/g.317418  ORF Transcript_98981/g.317418 Transcript_98981/m.317418 type:complete len:329 (+) Transcript_98981:3895-4881(+)
MATTLSKSSSSFFTTLTSPMAPANAPKGSNPSLQPWASDAVLATTTTPTRSVLHRRRPPNWQPCGRTQYATAAMDVPTADVAAHSTSIENMAQSSSHSMSPMPATLSVTAAGRREAGEAEEEEDPPNVATGAPIQELSELASAMLAERWPACLWSAADFSPMPPASSPVAVFESHRALSAADSSEKRAGDRRLCLGKAPDDDEGGPATMTRSSMSHRAVGSCAGNTAPLAHAPLPAAHEAPPGWPRPCNHCCRPLRASSIVVRVPGVGRFGCAVGGACNVAAVAALLLLLPPDIQDGALPTSSLSSRALSAALALASGRAPARSRSEA